MMSATMQWVLPCCPEQAPKFGGGRLHGESAQLFPSKGPPRMRSWQRWGRIDLHRRFVRASSRPAPTVEKAVSCYKADQLVASLLSFRSVQSSPAVREGGTLRTRPRTGVCEPDVVAPKAHQSYVSSADLPSDSLRENPEKPQNCQKWGWALARIWALVRVVEVKPGTEGNGKPGKFTHRRATANICVPPVCSTHTVPYKLKKIKKVKCEATQTRQ